MGACSRLVPGQQVSARPLWQVQVLQPVVPYIDDMPRRLPWRPGFVEVAHIYAVRQPMHEAVIVVAEANGGGLWRGFAVGELPRRAQAVVVVGVARRVGRFLSGDRRYGKTVGPLGRGQALPLDPKLVLFGLAAEHRVVVQDQATRRLGHGGSELVGRA